MSLENLINSDQPLNENDRKLLRALATYFRSVEKFFDLGPEVIELADRLVWMSQLEKLNTEYRIALKYVKEFYKMTIVEFEKLINFEDN